jgi:hypothetical protein
LHIFATSKEKSLLATSVNLKNGGKKMNVKQAIEKIAERMGKAGGIASNYRDKGNRMSTHLDEYDEGNERFYAKVKMERYYGRSCNAEDYMEELKELLDFMQTRNLEDKAVFISEEKMEENFGIYGNSDIQTEAWSNTIATVMECRNSGRNQATWVICIYKTLSDI